MATDKPRFSLTVDEETLKQIEDFRFEKRFQNRNQAIIELIKLGLKKINEETLKQNNKNR